MFRYASLHANIYTFYAAFCLPRYTLRVYAPPVISPLLLLLPLMPLAYARKMRVIYILSALLQRR